jgi:hypothetical protein
MEAAPLPTGGQANGPSYLSAPAMDADSADTDSIHEHHLSHWAWFPNHLVLPIARAQGAIRGIMVNLHLAASERRVHLSHLPTPTRQNSSKKLHTFFADLDALNSLGIIRRDRILDSLPETGEPGSCNVPINTDGRNSGRGQMPSNSCRRCHSCADRPAE